MSSLIRRTRLLPLVTMTALIGLAGCGGGDSSSGAAGESASAGDGTTRGSVDEQAPLYDALPDRIKEQQSIVLGSSIAYPPYEYFAEDGTTLLGFEPELSDALSSQLGVPFEWQDVGYDTLFTGLDSKRYDILWVGTNDTPEREETYDFVDYLESASGYVVPAGNPEGLRAPDDLCGKTVAVARGSLQESFLTEQQCSGAPLEVLSLGGDAEAQLAVKQGRAAALLTNYPSGVAYAEASEGSLEALSEPLVLPSYYGILVRKEDSQLRDVLADGLQNIVESGEYQEIIERWGLQELELDSIIVNGATQ
jgi:polar amino acid transport system substrate-binding protein